MYLNRHGYNVLRIPETVINDVGFNIKGFL